MYKNNKNEIKQISPKINSIGSLGNPLESLIDSYLGMYQKIEDAQIPEEAKKGLYALVTADLMGQVLGKGLNNMMMGYAMKGLEGQMQGNSQSKYAPSMHHSNPISSEKQQYGSLPEMPAKGYQHKQKNLESKI